MRGKDYCFGEGHIFITVNVVESNVCIYCCQGKGKNVKWLPPTMCTLIRLEDVLWLQLQILQLTYVTK